MEGDIQQWLSQVLAWQKATPSSSMRDQHRQCPWLATFLQQLTGQLMAAGSVGSALERWPQVGHLLGRLCTLPVVIADQHVVEWLLRCLITFWSPNPMTLMEAKAKSWARSQLWSLVCHLSEHFPMATLQQIGATQHHYNQALIHVLKSQAVSGKPAEKKTSKHYDSTAGHLRSNIMDDFEACIGPTPDDASHLCGTGVTFLADIETMVISLVHEVVGQSEWDQQSLQEKVQEHPLVYLCSGDMHVLAAMSCMLQHFAALCVSCPVVRVLHCCLLDTIRRHCQESPDAITDEVLHAFTL